MKKLIAGAVLVAAVVALAGYDPTCMKAAATAKDACWRGCYADAGHSDPSRCLDRCNVAFEAAKKLCWTTDGGTP
jgi:hypothetical protein